MRIIETKRAVYKVTPSLIKPNDVFNVVRTSKKTGRERSFEAWNHQVQYWKRISI
jgi:hypothetical protein